MKSFTLERPEDLETIAAISNLHGGRNQWWRGHCDAAWKIQAGIYRNPSRNAIHETAICSRFRAQARTRRDDCPDYDDLPAWLLLMQHYGLPTRILDWSEALIIGLYFAVSEPDLDDRDGALWAIDPLEFNKAFSGKPCPLQGVRSPLVRKSAARAFNYTLAATKMKCVAFQPSHFDLRMMIQHAYCTIHDDDTPLEEHKEAPKFLCKVEIPARRKAYWRQLLVSFGVRAELIFPDLTTLANSIKGSLFFDAEGK